MNEGKQIADERREVQMQLKSAWRRDQKLHDKIERLKERLAELSAREKELSG